MDRARSQRRPSGWWMVAVAVLVAVMPAAATPAVAGAAVEPPEPTADGAGTAKYRPVVDAAVTPVAALLAVSPLSKPPLIELLDKKLAGGGRYAQAWYYGESGTCLVQLQPAGQQLNDVDLAFALTHELVHCYQDRETGGAAVPDWVQEGAATWVGARLAPGSAIAKELWGPYLAKPTKSLYARAYDGIGFFAHLEHTGVDVGPRIVKMMTAGSDDAAFAIGIADGAAVLDNWPTGLARDTALGVAWATDGPDIPATKPPRDEKSVGNATVFTTSIATAAVALLELDVKADVLTVDAGADAHGRVRDSSGVDRLLSDVAGRPLCARAGGCVCPGGSPAAGITLAAVAPGTALLGATGGSQPTTIAVAGRSLDDFCAKPAKVDPCIVGTWIGKGVSLDVPGTEIVGAGGEGAVLRFEKTGAGSVDMDPSVPVDANLPGGLIGSFKFSGKAAGIVSASKGVMRTLATTASNFVAEIDVPPLGHQALPLSGSASGAPFDGVYTCSATTLVYTAAALGSESTWTRS